MSTAHRSCDHFFGRSLVPVSKDRPLLTKSDKILTVCEQKILTPIFMICLIGNGAACIASTKGGKTHSKPLPSSRLIVGQQRHQGYFLFQLKMIEA